MDIDQKSLYWLAGLLEGEGSFASLHQAGKYPPQISLNMTDEPIVARVSQLFNVKYHRAEPQKEHWKPEFRVSSRGYNAFEIMTAIYPMMGNRRRAKFDEIFSLYTYIPGQLGENSPNSKLTDAQVREIKRRLLKKEFARTIAADYGVTIYTIREISQGKVWKHISPDDEETPIPEIPLLPVDYNSLDWLSGILEAEGSFLAPPPSASNTPGISISMTDEDVIARVAVFFGTKYHRVLPKRENAKYAYTAHLRGSRAHDLMKQLYPLMGERRQAQIDRALANYTYNPVKRLDIEIVRQIKQQLLEGKRIRAIAEEFNLPYYTVKFIRQNRRYKDVEL